MKINLIQFALITALFIVISSFDLYQNSSNNLSGGDNFEIPQDIQTIFDKSCFGCHNVDAKSDKAKKKLLIDQLQELSRAKLVGKLSEISETVKEKDMPPEKFLQKYPDKALTEEESDRLVEWADNSANELMN